MNLGKLLLVNIVKVFLKFLLGVCKFFEIVIKLDGFKSIVIWIKYNYLYYKEIWFK